MKANRLLIVLAVVAVAAFGGEAFARGGGGGGGGARGGSGSGVGGGQGMQNRNQEQTRSQSGSQSQTQVKPEGSQRRDGTFLQTGTTANGSTTRPSNGRGAMDGSGINAVPTTTTVP